MCWPYGRLAVWQPTTRTADVTVTKFAGYVRVRILMNRWFFSRIFGIHTFYATATLLNIWICMQWTCSGSCEGGLDFVYRLATATRMPLLMTTGTRVLTFNHSSPPPTYNIHVHKWSHCIFIHGRSRSGTIREPVFKSGGLELVSNCFDNNTYRYTPQASLYRNTCALSESSTHNQSSVSAIYTYTCVRVHLPTTWWCKTSLWMFNADLNDGQSCHSVRVLSHVMSSRDRWQDRMEDVTSVTPRVAGADVGQASRGEYSPLPLLPEALGVVLYVEQHSWCGWWTHKYIKVYNVSYMERGSHCSHE